MNHDMVMFNYDDVTIRKNDVKIEEANMNCKYLQLKQKTKPV